MATIRLSVLREDDDGIELLLTVDDDCTIPPGVALVIAGEGVLGWRSPADALVDIGRALDGGQLTTKEAAQLPLVAEYVRRLTERLDDVPESDDENVHFRHCFPDAADVESYASFFTVEGEPEAIAAAALLLPPFALLEEEDVGGLGLSSRGQVIRLQAGYTLEDLVEAIQVNDAV